MLLGFREDTHTHEALDAETYATLRLIRSENLGVRTLAELLRVYDNADIALKKLENQLAHGKNKRKIRLANDATIEQEITATHRYGAQFIPLHSLHYPALLKHIYDAPPVLIAYGNITLLQKPSMAIVGARNASASGCRMAYKLAEEFAEAGYAVTSGLARGIDTAAHKGALDTATIAVIAGGIDRIYPPENEALYQSIAKKGLILAELPLGTVPRAQHFPQRNRIISGLSEATTVVEAAKRSGSLVTARFAAEQGREVCAVPGSPLDGRCGGPNSLIKDGATLVESADDVLRSLAQPNRFAEEKGGAYSATLFEETVAEETIENTITEDVKTALQQLLSHSPTSLETLIEQLDCSPQAARIAVLELELEGEIDRHPGDMISLSG